MWIATREQALRTGSTFGGTIPHGIMIVVCGKKMNWGSFLIFLVEGVRVEWMEDKRMEGGKEGIWLDARNNISG